MIMPYNRVVKDLNGYSVEDFKKLVSEKFDIQESDSAVSPDKNQYLECILTKMV